MTLHILNLVHRIICRDVARAPHICQLGARGVDVLSQQNIITFYRSDGAVATAVLATGQLPGILCAEESGTLSGTLAP